LQEKEGLKKGMTNNGVAKKGQRKQLQLINLTNNFNEPSNNNSHEEIA